MSAAMNYTQYLLDIPVTPLFKGIIILTSIVITLLVIAHVDLKRHEKKGDFKL